MGQGGPGCPHSCRRYSRAELRSQTRRCCCRHPARTGLYNLLRQAALGHGRARSCFPPCLRQPSTAAIPGAQSSKVPLPGGERTHLLGAPWDPLPSSFPVGMLVGAVTWSPLRPKDAHPPPQDPVRHSPVSHGAAFAIFFESNQNLKKRGGFVFMLLPSKSGQDAARAAPWPAAETSPAHPDGCPESLHLPSCPWPAFQT